jgi:hypothetical protein
VHANTLAAGPPWNVAIDCGVLLIVTRVDAAGFPCDLSLTGDVLSESD